MYLTYAGPTKDWIRTKPPPLPAVLGFTLHFLLLLASTNAWVSQSLIYQSPLLSSGRQSQQLRISTIHSASSLRATLEDHKSSSSSEEEEQQRDSPPPRRTRRIDDILDEYEATGDAGRTISILESSLKREKERSSTLAVRLAYAEKVIEEQKRRLEERRSSLFQKSQALSETQRKLTELEGRLRGNPIPTNTSLPSRPIRRTHPPFADPEAPWQQPPLTSTQRQYPLITNWSMNQNTGEVTGSVSCHPSIPDGTTIVTSGLNPESFALAGDDFFFQADQPAIVVTTRSGSMYQLGVKKTRRQPPPSSQAVSPKQQQKQPRASRFNIMNPNLDFPLTGQSISNGRGTKYLLAGSPMRKPSGRSEITMAYKCDDQLKVCESVPHVVKLSTYKDKLQREFENYRKVQEQTNGKGKGWIGGISNLFDQQGATEDPFVSCYDFLPVCEGSIKYAQHSALVLGKGQEDLRDFEQRLQDAAAENNPGYPVPATSMDLSVVRASLLAAANCLNILHSRARLVWTDLKAENLIFMETQSTDPSPTTIVDIKGVDLESAMPHRGNPLDYTPEACPPEFAEFHRKGNPYDFVLEYSYDVWSFGMLAYELATGGAYFRGKNANEIMEILADPNFVPPLRDEDDNDGVVADPQLRDLIRACLQTNPRMRITVPRILRHPFFQASSSSPKGVYSNHNPNPNYAEFW